MGTVEKVQFLAFQRYLIFFLDELYEKSYGHFLQIYFWKKNTVAGGCVCEGGYGWRPSPISAL